MSIVKQPQVLALLAACFLMSLPTALTYTFFSIYLVEHGYARARWACCGRSA